MNTQITLLLIVSQIWMNPTVTAQNVIDATAVGDKIEIRINGDLFTNYIISEYEKYPFFYPVNGPSKASVTSMRNANYPHHSSLFFGCDKVNGGNYWQEKAERGQIFPLRVEIVKSGGEQVVIENENIWKRDGAMSPIRDFRIITISAPANNLFQIDFEIRMEMLMDVTIDKTNHSLFSGRIDPDLAAINGGTMVNAEGELGEENTFGKSSSWMDYHGQRMGKIEGLAILQHPSNLWFPAPWFTRDYGFFSPTPMYWPKNETNITFKKGESIQLKYRVLVHSGDHKEAKIAEMFEKYKNE